MPTFENLIVGAPVGFSKSCSELNDLASSDPEQLANLVIKSLSIANFVPSDSSEQSKYKEIKAINFIVRSYKTANPSPSFPQLASTLDQNTLLTRDSVEKIIVAIQNASTTNQNVPLLSQVRCHVNFFLSWMCWYWLIYSVRYVHDWYCQHVVFSCKFLPNYFWLT